MPIKRYNGLIVEFVNIVRSLVVFNIIMEKLGAYIVIFLIFLTAFSEAGWAIDNYPTSMPVSFQQDGLVRTPNPIDNTSSLLVTGNVRGGSYFRGVVPYSSPTYFSGALASSSLDPFLRGSAGAEYFGRYSRYSSYTFGYSPYYSQTQTVTTINPGSSSIITPPTADFDGYIFQSDIMGTSPLQRDAVLDITLAMPSERLRPLSMTPKEMEKLIASEIAELSSAKQYDRQYETSTKQFKSELDQAGDDITDLMRKPDDLGISLLSPAAEKLDSNLPATEWWLETPARERKQQAEEETAEVSSNVYWLLEPNEPLDVYEQMKQQLDSSKEEIIPVAQQDQNTVEGSEKPDLEQMWQRTSEFSEERPKRSQTEEFAENKLFAAAKAKAALGSFDTFASFSEDKFNQYMRAAEQYLKQGKYYRAADAYTLASIYKPDDPLAYAGKSHALFASGEYMSSALFLSRALRIFPEYAGFKIDLVAMVGDRDKLEGRVVDVEEWLRMSGAPELEFLLAYVYYRMDRLKKAKGAISAAYEKMPEAPAVLALKKAIEANQTSGGFNSLRITK